MRKPTFTNPWFKHKRPELWIKILKSIVWSGQLSKKKLADRLEANYSDISDAVDALLARQFIRFSGKWLTTGRRPEKFYKITEDGLRALLSIDLYPNEFWKAIVLLCDSSKKQLSRKEFEDYYLIFERNFLGHVKIPGYFFLSSLFDSFLEQELHACDSYDAIPISQIIIECLALNGSVTLEELFDLSRAKKNDVIRVLNKYSIQRNPKPNSHLGDSSHNTLTDQDIQMPYHNFLSHLLIVSTETVKGTEYSLSLFGVMFAISLIRYYYKGANDSCDLVDSDYHRTDRLVLFYSGIDEKEYFETIVKNYSQKVPLIFGKWGVLKSELGSILLFEAFDILIFKNDRSRNMHTSILSGGNKEFYDDMMILSYNALNKLRLVYGSGTHILNGYEKIKPDIPNDFRILPIYAKVREIRDLLNLAEISAFLQGLTTKKLWRHASQDEGMISQEVDNIEKIELIFSVELCFLFYLNLNTIFFSKSNKDVVKIENKRPIIPARIQEIYQLGSPRQRLMAIFAKDKEIKQSFLGWIQDIIDYRIKTFDMMSDFYKEINELHKKAVKLRIRKSEPVIEFLHEEYDMSKICSVIHAVYDYPNS